MFGRNFGCSKCNFEWGTGWSHHVGGQFLICRSCGTPILAGRGTCCWGPKSGERLELFCYLGEEWQPSGIFVTVPPDGRATEDSMLPDVVREGIACPHCHATSAVTDTLLAGQPCPKCKRGIVEERG